MAFRSNWYDDERSSGAWGWRPANWSGFRWILTLTLAAFVLELLTIRSFPQLFVWGSLRAWWGGLEGLSFNPAFPLQLVTYALLHDPVTLGHVGWNLFYLWMFAPELEAEYGRAGLLKLYAAGAVFGGLVQWGWWLARLDPGSVVGASGAVYTVMVLFTLKWPHRTFLLFGLLPLPVWVLTGARVLMDLIAFVNGTEGSTAVLVHLGGAAVGLAWFRGAGALSRWSQARKRDKALRAFQEESTDRREMDRILAKIQASGLGSLDGKERAFLERRSRQLRDQGP